MTMPTNDPSRLLGKARPEASFYPWQALTKEQRRVAIEVLDWLDAFACAPIPSRRDQRTIFDWNQIDEKRASNVIVIDGPRGAGKTSLTLTLMEVWRRSLAQEGFEEVFAPIEQPVFGTRPPGRLPQLRPTEQETPNTPGSPAVAREAINRLRTRIIPIRVLDFAPLPHSTSLVTWVAAQLREFIDLLDERTTPRFSDVSTHPVLPWEPDWDKELPSRKAWAELTACAAWGWDDNIQARKGGLDPDAYAEELQQSERARVGILERWRRLLGSIVHDAAQRYPGQIKPEARIIVSIDDVDMNPQRMTDLLEFVSTFWDPQLVFLLSGDSDLILAALEQRYARALDLSASVSNFTLSPHEMAAQTYDKVVPLAQRFRLGLLDTEERLGLLRNHLPSESLGQHGIQPSTSLPPATLDQLLCLDPWAAEALPATLRAIHDTRQSLMQQVHDPRRGYMRPKTVTEVVTEWWYESLNRAVPDRAKRQQVSERVDFSSEGTPAVEGAIYARAERLGEVRVGRSGTGGDGPTERRIRLVLEAASRLVPCDMPDNRRLHGVFLLAADLAGDDPDAAWSAISIAGSGYRFPAVRARIDVPITAPDGDPETRRRAQILVRRGVRWPLPNWPAPIDHCRFALQWRGAIADFLEKRTDSNFTRDSVLATRFLDLMRFVFEQRATYQGFPESLSLASAMQSVYQQSIDGSSPRQRAYFGWARERALLLAAPESGLHTDTAKEILSVFQDENVTDIRTGIQRARFERACIHLEAYLDLPARNSSEVHPVMQAIDAVFPEHPWVQKFGRWTPDEHLQEAIAGSDMLLP